MNDEDTTLRRAFRGLRDHDEQSAPSFARVLARAEGALRTRRDRARSLGAALAFAIAIVLAFSMRRPSEPEAWPTVQPLDTLAFLMEPPSVSVVGPPPRLHAIERSW